MATLIKLLGNETFLRKLLWFTTGAGLLWIANNAFDWILYPFGLCQLGFVGGAIVMAVVSLPFNLLMIKGYDAIGEDLLALETVKDYQLGTNPDAGFFERLITKALKRGKWAGYLALSAYDPIPATIYIRQGHRSYDGLRGMDWFWFVISTIIANAIWALLIISGIEAIGVCAN